MKFNLAIISILALTACSKSKETGQFQLMNSKDTGIRFVNSITSTNDFNILTYRNFYNGGGVGIGDINNDQLPDIYLISNMSENRLFLNLGDFHFEDITEKAGIGGTKAWSTGVCMVDINADGLLDIYVTNAGTTGGDKRENELFINNGNLTFTENAAEYGLSDSGISTHAAFFDYDLDGDLDAYILNNSFISATQLNYNDRREVYAEDWNLPDSTKGGGDKLLRNDNGKFVDVTRTSGIYGSLIGFGLGITVGDVNADNYLDIYISNDFYERDYLYINQGNGTFKESITEYMGHISMFSMGADMADINNDGYPEIFVTDMLSETDVRVKERIVFEDYNTYLVKKDRGFYNQYLQNTLQLNNQNGTFSEIARYSGVAATDWSWGALIFDGDNDGLKDLFVSNGVYRDMTDQDFVTFFANDALNLVTTSRAGKGALEMIDRMPSDPIPNKYFKNLGNLKFEDIGNTLGFETNTFSNGSAYGDLDNDGDLDLVINNLNEETFIYKNEPKNANHYLAVHLKGDSLNTFAIGSSVRVYASGQNFNSELIPTRGFQSSVDYKIVLGLGKVNQIDSLEIKWPNGKITKKYHLPVDTVLHFSYTQEDKKSYQMSSPLPTLLSEVNTNIKGFDEDYYFDFFYEGLLAKMISQEGPDVTVADVNGDGLEDFYIGGPANSFGLLYLQEDGEFKPVKIKDIADDQRYEDTEVLFFDANGNGHPDLFIGSGGNITTVPQDDRLDRLYLNDGKGNFIRTQNALPDNIHNTSVALPLDFDSDGDLDLIVANHSQTGVYGLDPESYLYENNGNAVFQNVTATRFPELLSAGMITDALLTDLNGNDFADLLLIGEWMSPKAYELKAGEFVRLSLGLEAYTGWWGAIEASDLDNDGDQDLILGNLGENSSIKGNPENPLKLWVKDFDNNGTVEKILTKYMDGKDKPLASKREITSQLPSLKKQNLKHSSYATKGIKELFTSDELENTEIKEAVWFKSIVAINDGAGNFLVKEFPWQVQLSCVCDIYCSDLNGDGFQDIILGGNDDTYQPQFSKLDASPGSVLINDQQGGFDLLSIQKSGLAIQGEIKKLIELNLANNRYLLITRNEDKPRLFKLPN